MPHLRIDALFFMLCLAPIARSESPIEDQHRRCVESQKRLKDLKKEIVATNERLEGVRQDLLRKLAVLEARKDELKELRPPEIDYSKYNRCPNGEPWSKCNHETIKAAWLREQQQDYLQKRQDLLADIRRIQADFNGDLERYKQDLDDHRKKQNSLTEGIRTLNEELRALHRMVQDRISALERGQQLSHAALRRVQAHLPETSRALQDWVDLNLEARDEASWKALTTFGTILLTNKQLSIQKDEKVLQNQLQRIENELFNEKFKLYDNPELRQAMQQKWLGVYEVLKKVRKGEDVVSALEHRQEFADLTRSLSKAQKLDTAAQILNIFAPPGGKLLVADVDICLAAGYAHAANRISNQEVDRLLTLSEDQLTEIRNYSRVLVDQTKELRKLRALEKALNGSN